MKYAVGQIGARRHYLVPRAMHEAGMLERFYTDLCSSVGWLRWLHLVPPALRSDGLRRLLGRMPAGVPRGRIVAFNRFGFAYARQRRDARSAAQTAEAHLRAGQRFCELLLAHDAGRADAVYGFNKASLEMLRAFRSSGRRTVLDQTSTPRTIEHALLAAQAELHPEWHAPLDDADQPDALAQRESAEWDEADVIICGSTFVRDGIVACGGPSDRCRVVPAGLDLRGAFDGSGRKRPPDDCPLRVLTVGNVSLHKGSATVLEVARAFDRQRVQFRMVGSVSAPDAVRPALHTALELSGAVPRSDMPGVYAAADVFLLPSLAEGSSLAVYEAMAAGLPVICTANTGSIVRDGVDGYIVGVGDAAGIIARLDSLARDRDLLVTLSQSARTRVADYSLEHYRQRLTAAIALDG
ncbi:MAG: glycosyltransferase family 4 protein [Planctomycetota bacterium]